MYSYLGIGVLVLLALWAAGSYLVTRNIEEATFTTLEKRSGFTIRQYNPYIVAETTVDAKDSAAALNQGFRLVADYIFGNNTTSEKISMTAPVLEQSGKTNEKIAMTVPVLEQVTDTNARTVGFVLPASYTLDTLPTPNNTQVTLREVPAYKAAVLRFGWYATPQRVDDKKAELQRMLKEAGFETIGEPQAAFYNPPLSFPLTLRNEIIIEISKHSFVIE